MDDAANTRRGAHGAPDLASIVLADARARRTPPRDLQAPEPAPLPPLPTVPRGYEARSALVLAIVVAALAAVVGWSTTIDERPSASPRVDRGESSVRGSGPVVGAPDDASPPGARERAAAPVAAGGSRVEPAPAGTDLAPGRIVALRSGAGGGIIRVGVANHGRDALDTALGTRVAVLLDGAIVGEAALGSVPAAGSSTVELTLEECPAGRHAVVAVVDPAGVVHEPDERNNAATRMVSFAC